ncbi:MAG: hypothetical protein JXR70_10185 [Spirochaetales bacterium]|nr:hypothetical protein [Spirochaetales bacterium]
MKTILKLSLIVFTTMILLSSCTLWDTLFGPAYLGDWEFSVDDGSYQTHYVWSFGYESFQFRGEQINGSTKIPYQEVIGIFSDDGKNNMIITYKKGRFFNPTASQWTEWMDINIPPYKAGYKVDGDVLILSSENGTSTTLTRVK